MTTVLETALQQENMVDGIRTKKIRGLYLADQGVVFEVVTSEGLWRFDASVGGMPRPPIPPRPEVMFFGSEEGHHSVHIEIDEEALENTVNNAMRQLHSVMLESSGQLYAVAEKERELRFELRDLERELSHLEFEARHADEDSKKNLAKAVGEKKKHIQEKQQLLNENMREINRLKEIQKKSVTEKKQQNEKRITAFLDRFEKVIGETLCKFGMGLKSISDTEHVSFVLRNMGLGSEVKGARGDKVYVFDKKSIDECVKDKRVPSELINEARTYVY